MTHLVCKPGGEWVEQAPAAGRSPRGGNLAWQPFEAAGVRYASTVDPASAVWRGEVSVPWQAVSLQGRGRPGLLRFNFLQHRHATGESSSWSGPIDQSRDSRMMGVLFVKDSARER